MQLLIYLLFYPLLILISILPFRLFYFFSDVVYVVVYHIIGYRKKTVTENLKLVFPNKSSKEIIYIRKKFYKHMCDMFLEMIKTITVSKKELNKRFVIINPEELIRLEKLHKSVIVMYGHYASYEWSIISQNYTKLQCYGIYKKIKNKYFDALVHRIRSRYNTILFNTKEAIPAMARLKAKGEKYLIAFLSDQSPKIHRTNEWLDFMGINVPCSVGAEMLAKKLDYSVAYLKINKVKRGHYEGEFVSLADDAQEFENYKITEKFNNILASQIKAAPEYYLWTHKRWKHRDETPM